MTSAGEGVPPRVCGSVAMGSNCIAPHGHAIAIGEGAVTEREYEICIKVGDMELREIMTPTEYETVYVLLRRMIQNNTLGPKGILG